MPTPILFRQRARKPKVKTGCLTCKIRHVKCDEAKPGCLKCTHTGRKCDGYEDLTLQVSPQAKPRTPITHGCRKSMSNMPSNIEGDEQERRGFQFFYERTMPEISGYFPFNFWTNLILPACHIDPAVLHAIIALGSVHEMYGNKCDMSPKTEEEPEPRSQFALQQSIKAMRHLSRQITDSAPRSGEMILLSCILFVFLEMFQRNHKAALSHLDCGLKILGSWLHEDSQPIFKEGLVSRPSVMFLQENIVPIFTLLDVQASTFTTTRSVHREYILKNAESVNNAVVMPSRFLSLNEAMASLHDLFHWMLHSQQTSRMHCSFAPGDPVPTFPLDLFQRFVEVQKQSHCLLERWLNAINVFLKDYSATLGVKDLRGAMLLKIKHLNAFIFNGACLSLHEMLFDIYIPEFERMVNLSAALLKHPGSSTAASRKSSYSFDMNVLAPLYHTVCRCREPSIRRKALALLQSSPRREGAWDSEVLVAIGSWAMLKEEDGLGEVSAAAQVPLEARVCIVDKVFTVGERQCVVKYRQGLRNWDCRSGVKAQVITW